jgi:ferredoxin-type protein NapH
MMAIPASTPSIAQKIFLALYFPAVILFYLFYKYPTNFVAQDAVRDTFYLFGKSPSFWYAFVYSLIVAVICLRVISVGINPYWTGKKSKPLSTYQRWKWISILFSQVVVFFFLPFVLPWLLNGGEFFNDQYKPLNKDAYVYVYNGFRSLGGFLYIFALVPLSVYFFGKRYCTWFCSCGNLAEAIGVTKWGRSWVWNHTPRSAMSKKMEHLQTVFLGLAVLFGIVLFLDGLKIAISPDLIEFGFRFQALVVDLIFGALIGLGAYPIMGTRIWCRYGCPLAKMMELFGKYSGSKARIEANEKCKGIGFCNKVCPVGIDIEKRAHLNKKAILGSYGLDETPCISCGSCIEVCPRDALKFSEIFTLKKDQ